MAAVTEQISEVLLGAADEPELTQQARATFMRHAVKDEESGEYFLNENQFIDAIAPESEDYVSSEILGLPSKCTFSWPCYSPANASLTA